MNILVTGSDGFVGSRVYKALESKGHNVYGYDISSENDVLDRTNVFESVCGKNIVYHIAAQADLTQVNDLSSARGCVDVNVQGTHNVIQACVKHGAWLIYASTCCVYGNSEAKQDNEDTTLPKPTEIYAASKLAGENLVNGYIKSFGLDSTILRYATIYGPGMRPALTVYKFLKRAYAGKVIEVHGDGVQERIQTYIDDLVKANVEVADNPEAKGHIINVTNKQAISVNKMAQDIINITNSTSPIEHVEDRPGQIKHEDIDITKAQELLGWSAHTSWKKGLAKTNDWFRNTQL